MDTLYTKPNQSMYKDKHAMIRYFFFSIIPVLILFVIMPANRSSAASGDNPLTLAYDVRLSGQVYDFSMDAEGGYYFIDNWANGHVTLTSGEKVSGERLKYNAYLDELVWLSAESYRPVQIDKRLVKQFSITLPGQDHPAVFHRISIDEAFESDPVHTYVQLIYDGDISLFVHRRVVKTGERLKTVRGSLHAIPKLDDDPVYYIITSDDQIKELSRLSRRALYGIFPDNRQDIRNILRDERLLIRSETDLIRAVSLIEHKI